MAQKQLSDIDLTDNKIVNLADGVDPGDAVNKSQLDGVSGGGSPLTTKGDLFVFATAADRLPVGADGAVLMADSGEASGLRYGLLGMASIYNYVANPSFETGYTGWANYGGYTNAPVRSTAFSQSGTYSSFQDNAASSNDGGILSSQFSLPAGTYTFSVYAKLSSGVTNANMIVRSGAGLHVQINQTYPGNTNFNRYTGTFTLATAQTGVEILLGMGSYGSGSAGSVYYDAVQIEEGVSATSYFDGDTAPSGGNTYSWSGTTGISQSIRATAAALTSTDYLIEGTVHLYFQTARAIAAMTGATINPSVVSAGQVNASALYAESVRTAMATKTANYTLTAGDNVILFDATSGNLTAGLPSASDADRREYTIKKIDATVNTVTIDPNGSETIDGATTLVLSAQWKYAKVKSNGTAWYLIGNN